jgi:hypothetical protein
VEVQAMNGVLLIGKAEQHPRIAQSIAEARAQPVPWVELQAVILACFFFEISQIFRRRCNTRKQQVFARPRAGDVEKPPFSFVDVVQFRFVSGVGDALVEWQNALIAGHHNDCTKFQTLGEAHLRGHHLGIARQPVNPSPGAHNKLRRRVKGQIMAVECGMLSFNDVFLPFMLTHDGRTVSERADQLGLLSAGAEP